MPSPHEAESFQRDLIDNQKSPSDREELRQNIAQLKLGEECLLRKRLLGGAGNQDYETYSLPVSRLPSNDYSNDPSYAQTPNETPGTSRVATRDSQSSLSVPTKSHSPPHETATSTAPTSHPTSSSSHGSADDRPHQVKFMIPDSTSESPPATAAGIHTPVLDPNDPYRRSRRKPQTTNLAEIPDRFHFDKVTKKRQSQQLHYFDKPVSGPHSSHSHTHHHGGGGLLHSLNKKSLKDHFGQKSGHESSSDELHEDQSGSHVSLRRFFRGGQSQKKSSRPTTPTSPSTPAITPLPSASRRPMTPPPAQKRKSSEKRPSASTMPFGDDHAGLGLTERYGKFGKVLGAGAGGSVRLMKRASDGTTFAVKEFVPRGEHETQREYAKKVNSEFTIGSIVSHQNIVETLDIVNEGGRYFEVMEYCRYDLFGIVMTGKQTEEEIGCCFKQIVAGTRYLHEMGLAHRDLKLDNCCVNEFGIVKIIDFGCAVVFKYPFEQDIIEATGIVGSDPYLAPEVCKEIRYNPQPADIWSLAIIYCCMAMRRFPWKAPRMSDPSFKNFASSPNPYTTPADSRSASATVSRKSTVDSSSTLTPSDSSSEKRITTTTSGSSSKRVETPDPLPINKGPMKLLNRLSPPACRPLLGRMLDLNPKTRATMEEIWADPWFMGLKRCEMVEERLPDGTKRMIVKRSGTHTHILVGPNGEDVSPSGTSIKRP